MIRSHSMRKLLIALARLWPMVVHAQQYEYADRNRRIDCCTPKDLA
jgi:hypothetical protein